jgi:hypothetical protein
MDAILHSPLLRSGRSDAASDSSSRRSSATNSPALRRSSSTKKKSDRRKSQAPNRATIIDNALNSSGKEVSFDSMMAEPVRLVSGKTNTRNMLYSVRFKVHQRL